LVFSSMPSPGAPTGATCCLAVKSKPKPVRLLGRKL
jgi:hypothetical protein